MNRYLKNTKYSLLTGWNFGRLLRLGLAIVVLVEFSRNPDWLLGVLGFILLAQAFFNVGCCGVYGCEVPQRQSEPGSINEKK
jgi:hypothetical protein